MPLRLTALAICNIGSKQHVDLPSLARCNRRTNEMSDRKIIFADQLRGIAACCVVIEHAAHAAPTALQTVVVQFPLSFGQFGVALFFLISGFVIPISVTKYRVVPFLVARSLRIYPTYIAGFSITLVGLFVMGLAIGPPFTVSFGVILQYCLLVRDFFGPTDLDPVIWTLVVELKFYLVCCAAAPWLRGFSLRIFSLPFVFAACCAILTGAIAPASAFGWGHVTATIAVSALIIPFMLIGTAFYYHFSGRISSGALLLVTTASFAAFKIAWSLGPTPEFAGFTTSYGFAVLIFAGCYLIRSRFRANRIAGFFSDISYPLYVVHAGIITLLVKLATIAHLPAMPAVAAGVCASVGVALLIHIVIESPTHRLGKKFARENIP